MAAVLGFDGFKCSCADAMFCRGCNCCLKHCRCKGVPEIDLPLTQQLAEARREWRRMGVVV